MILDSHIELKHVEHVNILEQPNKVMDDYLNEKL